MKKIKFVLIVALAAAVFPSSLQSVTDDQAKMFAEITLEEIKKNLGLQADLSDLGKEVSIGILFGLTGGFLSKSLYAGLDLADCEVAPYEIIEELKPLLSNEMPIETFLAIPGRMGDWLLSQPQAVLLTQEKVCEVGVVKYPFLTAAILLRRSLLSLGIVLLFGADSDAEEAVKTFFFNFYKMYYLPLLEKIIEAYGDAPIIAYEDSYLANFNTLIRSKTQEALSLHCIEHGIDQEMLLQPHLRSLPAAEGGASGSVGEEVSTLELPPRRVLVLDAADGVQDVRAKVHKHLADRLIYLSSVVTPEGIKGGLLFLYGLITESGAVPLFEHGSDSWDLIGSDLRGLMDKAIDPAQQISLEDICGILVKRNAYIDGIIAAVPEDILYGVAGNMASLEMPLRFYMGMLASYKFNEFVTLKVLRNMRDAGNSIPQEMVDDIASLSLDKLNQFYLRFAEIYGKTIEVFGSNLIRGIVDAKLPEICPGYYV